MHSSTSSFQPLAGMVAAVHTPFHKDGRLNLDCVELQADHLVRNQVIGAFVGGTTGECASLTLEERLLLTRRWVEVTKGSALKVVVHVGTNCLADAVTMAADAARQKVSAVSCFAPSYFKPRNLEELIRCCEQVAAAAPELPFYYYDIPPLTGLNLPMDTFLEKAATRIPTLAGLKFSNPDLVTYQKCLRAEGGRFDCPWGIDEAILGALAMGARGGVGSTYNFAAPIYHKLLAAFRAGDWETARRQQFRSVQLVDKLAARGFMASAKALMGFLGVDPGPPRLPHTALTPEAINTLRQELEAFGFFE